MNDIERVRYVRAARRIYGGDLLEVDDNAEVSDIENETAPVGAFVAAWVWVEADEARLAVGGKQ